MAQKISISKAKKEIGQKVDDFIKDLAIDLSNEMKREAPVNTGRLRNSIQVQKHGDGYIVGPQVNYAGDVQFGTDPHHVDLEKLEFWVRRKFNMSEPGSWAAAQGVQDSIEEDGTEANPFISRAIENLEDRYA